MHEIVDYYADGAKYIVRTFDNRYYYYNFGFTKTIKLDRKYNLKRIMELIESSL